MKEAFDFVLNYEPNTQTYLTYGFWLAVLVGMAVYAHFKERRKS